MPKNIAPLHFIGIGGIGMSGIAQILNTLGYDVQGSDLSDGVNVKRLRALGVRIAVGHSPDNLKSEEGVLPAAVVISSAVKDDNVELTAARELKIPVMRRAEMLAELMRLKHAVAVGGTHGKTTTTAMVGEMLEACGFDPTVINGGIVNAYGTNVRLGQSNLMVVEADESDGTFTRLPATIAIVTNMDAEHMEHYSSFENVREAYRRFINNIPFYGYAVLCIDHPEVQALVPSISDRRVITYGFNPQADIRGSNIRSISNASLFDVDFADGLSLKDMYLPMLGEHNVQNALAALAIAREMGVEAPLLKKALSSFTGVKRRFTKTGEVSGITIIDDYAHHPVEIETILKTARMAVQEQAGRVIAVMQPHRYSRLKDLFEEFCTCFNGADTVIVTDIYEAGESPIKGASRHDLVAGIAAHGHRHVLELENRKDLADIITEHAQSGDFVICMGAGDITAYAYDLPKQLEAQLARKQGNVA